MSYGYLIISDKHTDELQKIRHMKFDKMMMRGDFHVYARMEYMNTNHQLIDSHKDVFFCLSEYAFVFFNDLDKRNIYFNYFLLTKGFELDDVMDSAFTAIASPTSLPSLFLHYRGRIEVEVNKTYRLCFEPPSCKHKK